MTEIRTAKTILVIEDDAVLNDLMVSQLSTLGWKALGATSWKGAEEVLLKTEPDLVLLDMRLPDVDGFDLVTRLSKQFPTIILTAYGSIEQAVDAMKAGASEYLTKPVNLEELEIAVKRTLENAEMRKEHRVFSGAPRRLAPGFHDRFERGAKTGRATGRCGGGRTCDRPHSRRERRRQGTRRA